MFIYLEQLTILLYPTLWWFIYMYVTLSCVAMRRPREKKKKRQVEFCWYKTHSVISYSYCANRTNDATFSYSNYFKVKQLNLLTLPVYSFKRYYEDDNFMYVKIHRVVSLIKKNLPCLSSIAYYYHRSESIIHHPFHSLQQRPSQ